MSEESKRPEVELTASADKPRTSRWKLEARRLKLRRFLLRHLPLSIAGGVLLLIAAMIGLYFFLSSTRFENFVRHQIQAKIERATGAKVEIADFHWRLLDLDADAEGVILHGKEKVTEAPYMQVARLDVGVSVLGFFTPELIVRSLAIEEPKVHLIVYPNGSTNAPTPKKKHRSKDNGLESLFSLRVGQLTVDRGVLDYDDRAGGVDFQDRKVPLDFAARHLHLVLGFAQGKSRKEDRYHITTVMSDFELSRGTRQHPASPEVHGKVEGDVDIFRNAVVLNQIEVKGEEHTLTIRGRMDDFEKPRWVATVNGDFEMPLLEPLTGYPSAPYGLAKLQLALHGAGAGFAIDGSVHVDDAAYIGTGVDARNLTLDAHVHADEKQLLIAPAVVRLKSGGSLSGEVNLQHWLDQPHYTPLAKRDASYKPSDDYTIPVDGKVRAQFANVTLDALLTMVSPQPFQRLGFDTLINGPSEAIWSNGDANTLTVSSKFALTPSNHEVAGEKHASGWLDGTYTERDGAVDLRGFELHLPASTVQAHGHLGAYPMVSPSAIAVEVHSRDLSEFDQLFKDLGLVRNGRAGSAALPLALHGEADLTHAMWNGSLLDPHISGDLKATQLDLELDALAAAPTAAPATVKAPLASKLEKLIPIAKPKSAPTTPPPAPKQQWLHIDELTATGTYAAAKVSVDHALVRQGETQIAVDGTLTAPAGSTAYAAEPVPDFSGKTQVHAHLRTTHLSIDELARLSGQKIPAHGNVDAQLEVNGTLHAPEAAGKIDLVNAAIFDEPVTELHLAGTFANQQIQLSSLNATMAGGKITGSGKYDFNTDRFAFESHGTNLEIAHLAALRKKDLQTAGRINFHASLSGTAKDPQGEAQATIAGLSINGESLGSFDVSAIAANRSVRYSIDSHLVATTLSAHGETNLDNAYTSKIGVSFSKFDIATLLKLAKIPGLSGESSLAGTVHVEGPLARPGAMHGEARLRELGVTLDGVRLKSEGGLHAQLINGILKLDPLHITGDNTDLHAEGSLEVGGKQQIDFASSGTINLKVAETIDPDLQASGTSIFQLDAHGTLANPGLSGRVQIANAALSLGDLPNGLSQLHGELEFNQNRLEVKQLSAISGGGQINMNGYLAYQHGLYADLQANGKGIRIRYPQGVSSLADATLRLTGTEKSMTLGGDVVLTRFIVSPDFDFAALAAQTNTVHTVAAPDAASNRLLLNLHITSSPQLNFQNAYAKLAGNVDLRVRGTLATPSLLGRISVTEGSATLAGTRYDLQRGEIAFTNPVRIQPNIDLSATARAGDYDITLGMHGTTDKMSVSYRSDPPLAEADVVALLALGRTGEQRRLYTQQQQQTGYNPATDALLGGALNATVSSRVQKLFGSGSVKVDPNYVGALGNSTSRIIVESQLGRNLKLTYATNVNTTSQQLIQADIAINRHFSIVMARDESGVFSMVFKNSRRYK